MAPRKLSQRASRLLAEIGKVDHALEQLVIFAAQNPGISPLDFRSARDYADTTQIVSAQWRQFAMLCRSNKDTLAKITKAALVRAAGDHKIMEWDKLLDSWVLTPRSQSPPMDYRQEAIYVLMRALPRKMIDFDKG